MPSPWGRTTPSTWLVGQAGLGTAIPVTGESCSPERTNHEPKGLNSVKAKPEQKTWMSAKAVEVERCKLATQTEPEKANFYLSMSCSFTTLNMSRHQTSSCQHPQLPLPPLEAQAWVTYRPDSSSSCSCGLGLLVHRISVRRSPTGRAVQGVTGHSIVQCLVGTLLLSMRVKINNQFSDCFLHVAWRRQRTRSLAGRGRALGSGHSGRTAMNTNPQGTRSL